MTVGVAVMVEVGVWVSGRNRVAVGPNVGVALGIGEGRARVPTETGFARGAAVRDPLGSEGLFDTSEPMRPNLSRSNMLGRTAALDAKADAAKIKPPITSSRAMLISPARVRAILRLCFFEST